MGRLMREKAGGRLAYEYDRTVTIFREEDLIYIKRQHDRRLFVRARSQTFYMDGSLREKAGLFDRVNWVRPYSSYLVNRAYIAAADEDYVTLRDGSRIPVSIGTWRRLRRQVLEGFFGPEEEEKI